MIYLFYIWITITAVYTNGVTETPFIVFERAIESNSPLNNTYSFSIPESLVTGHYDRLIVAFKYKWSANCDLMFNLRGTGFYYNTHLKGNGEDLYTQSWQVPYQNSYSLTVILK